MPDKIKPPFKLGAKEKCVQKVPVDAAQTLVSSAHGRWEDGGDGFLYLVEPDWVKPAEE